MKPDFIENEEDIHKDKHIGARYSKEVKTIKLAFTIILRESFERSVKEIKEMIETHSGLH